MTESRPKIFGIGLSKTGTTSLFAALHHLGYETATYRHLKRLKIKDWFEGDFAHDHLAPWEAVTDLPIGTFFHDLDRRYPGSKFVLTCREIESWLDSARRHWLRRPTRTKGFGRKVRLATYGIAGYDAERFRFVYQAHERNVRWYFRDRPDDLLVMNMGEGDGWPELCRFLGKDVPDEPFPHVQPGFDPDADDEDVRDAPAAEGAADR
ncbi:MAG: sulfotransferase family protein [Planctomycetota bacterium JB042]